MQKFKNIHIVGIVESGKILINKTKKNLLNYVNRLLHHAQIVFSNHENFQNRSVSSHGTI